MNTATWFESARYGLFVHYGLYSMLGRAEWVMNREAIAPEDYAWLADEFTADKFDADAICDLAVNAGMRYIVFTTMHHDGFRLYDTKLTDFNSVKACGRDLTGEIVDAARKRDLKIGLYHSLNNWTDKPDAVDALEKPEDYKVFIGDTFERIRELVTRYNPIDTLWYDGWWPFDAEGWQAERMNAMVREIQPHILFNGRNGLPGDFSTPEGHLGAPNPWRPWEGCMSVNESWGYRSEDHDWKTPTQVAVLLATCAQGRGNLLLNIGPRGDGSVSEPAVETLEAVGQWLKTNGEAIFDTEMFTTDLREKGDHRGDWVAQGPLTVKGNDLYLLARYWPGTELVMVGLEQNVQGITLLGSEAPLDFTQDGRRLTIRGLPTESPDPVCPVFRIRCDGPPSVYITGGMRIPNVPHCHYDPCESEIAPGKTPGA